MAREALDAGQLDLPMLQQIDRLAERLPELIDEPLHPSLIYGEM